MNSTLASDDGSNLLVLLPKGSEFASAMLGREEIKKELLTFIEPVLGMRTVTYGESSLQNKAIADAERALKPQEPPRIRKRDAQPQGSAESAVSAAPVPVAAPAPAPVPVAAPAMVPAPVSEHQHQRQHRRQRLFPIRCRHRHRSRYRNRNKRQRHGRHQKQRPAHLRM